MEKYVAISKDYTLMTSCLHSWTVRKEYGVELTDNLVSFESDGGMEEDMPRLALPEDFFMITFGLDV